MYHPNHINIMNNYKPSSVSTDGWMDGSYSKRMDVINHYFISFQSSPESLESLRCDRPGEHEDRYLGLATVATKWPRSYRRSTSLLDASLLQSHQRFGDPWGQKVGRDGNIKNPPKTHMKPEKLVVCRCFFLVQGTFSASMLVFGGVNCTYYTCEILYHLQN